MQLFVKVLRFYSMTKRKRNILLLIESSTAYGRKIADGISQYVREQAHWTLHIEDRGLYSLPTALKNGWNGDGIIARTANGLIRRALERCRCPVVELLGGVDRGKSVDVTHDVFLGLKLCFEHYLSKRITSIGFYAFGRNWWIEQRRKLFLELAHLYQIKPLCFVDNSAEKSDQQPPWDDRYEKPLRKWIEKLPDRTGIIAANDYQAMRVLNACQSVGIDVPGRIAILGFDNDEHICNLVTPSLSSLNPNSEMIGYKAAELLDWKMSGKLLTPQQIIVPPKGVVGRRSSEIMAIDDQDVVTALNFIAREATRGLCIRDVVAHIGLSQSTLCRRFQKELHRTPQEEIMRVRLERAKYLLANSDLPIKSVAMQSGYHSIEYFTSTIKLHTNSTPQQYREKHRDKSHENA